jgi:hypothetical protein
VEFPVSDVIAIRVVCEGPTDTIMLRSAVAALGVDAVVTQIQPEDNSNLRGDGGLGEFGGGWKGVRAWCLNAIEMGGLRVVLKNARALVVHADADIAYEKDVHCASPCPPASDTADAVRAVVLGWLGVKALPHGIVLCIPAMSTEAWTFCALFPKDRMVAGIECRREPAALLVQKKPKLVARKGRRYAKDPLAYEKVFDSLVEGWSDSIPRQCAEGARFFDELRAVIT